MNARASLLILLLIAIPACDGGSSPKPTSFCPTNSDSVSVGSDVIVLPPSSAHVSGCQTLTPGAEVDAVSGGKAHATFAADASCTFTQLGSVTPGAPLKTAQVVSRDPPGAVFRMTNAQADCTVGSTMAPHLCGMATLQPSGGILQVSLACNNDPSIEVAIYRGSAVLRLDTVVPPRQINVSAGQLVRADPISGVATTSPASFTAQQLSLFEVQTDALIGGVSFADINSLLVVKSLVPSDAILSPTVLQGRLGKDYGTVRPMCASVSSAAIFYPFDPSSPQPQLFGGACGATTVLIYGLAIYQPNRLFYRGAQFYQASGGVLVRHEIFGTPVTLKEGASSHLFLWDGSLDKGLNSLATPSFAPRGIYVAKFVYSLPPDTTPHIALVAFSLAGAAFPPVIG